MALAAHAKPFSSQLYRMVEHQEQASTMELVDSFEKQSFLEDLLEETKPNELEPEYSYLIATPFRYPPLEWGSRFGTTFEPSLFYAGLSLEVVSAEVAYYLFALQDAQETPFNETLMLSRTSFEAKLNSSKHLDLLDPALDLQTDKLTCIDDYSYTHALGAQMREQGVKSFTYPSARHPEQLINAGVFTITVLDKKERNHLTWAIKQTPDTIQFLSDDSKYQFSYSIEDFYGHKAYLPSIP